MSNKYYAVRKGLIPGIYNSWEQCKAQVDGFSKAEYKSFKDKGEALAYLGPELVAKYCTEAPDSGEAVTDCDTASPVSDIPATAQDEVIAYVDGSYRDDTKEFSLGVVLFHRGQEHHLSQAFNSPDLASMRNVAGEIKASEAAMQYALDHNCGKLTIYHDYEGIAKWCTGEWKANKDGTVAYKMFYATASTRLDINFVKVAGHTGVKYNELADQLAKEALGII